MSAAAKPWKGQDTQDRRSNMTTSSIKASAKKDGAGGSYTWGGAMDVTDYDPVGLANMSKVVTVAQTTVAAPMVVQQAPAVISDTQQFPTLGAQPMASPITSARWAAPAAAVYQAPPVQTAPAPTVTVAPAVKTYTTVARAPAQVMSAGLVQATSVTVSPGAALSTTVCTSPVGASAPRVILNEDMMRAGVPTLDATHPRNAFVRKPHHKSIVGTAPATEVQEAPAVDWTAAGTTSFQQQVIHQVAQNPAHLGPYIAERPGPALSTLKAMPSPVAYIPNQKLSKMVASQPKMGKPQVMYQRKC